MLCNSSGEIRMKVEEVKTRTLIITEIESLSPITVYLTDYEYGKGKVIIECGSDCFSANWLAMGGSISEFLKRCDNDYLIGNFCEMINYHEDDFEAFLPIVKKHIIERRRLTLIDRDVARELFDWDLGAWSDAAPKHSYDTFAIPESWLGKSADYDDALDLGSLYIPQKETARYIYLNRILDNVRAALVSTTQKSVGLIIK